MDREEFKEIVVKNIVYTIALLCVCVAFCLIVYVVGKMNIWYFIVCLLCIMLNSGYLGYHICQYIAFKKTIEFENSLKEEIIEKIEKLIEREQGSPFKEFSGEEEK